MIEVDLTELEERISAYLDQDVTTPSEGSDDWNLRLKFINRRQDQWARAYDWEALRSDFKFTVTGINQASVALPVDFNRLGSEVILYGGGTDNGTAYPIIPRDQVRLYTTTDKYVIKSGNRNSGFHLNFNPGTLASGASLIASYYSIATSLASPANVSPIPDPEFLVTGTIADILESRSDERFPLVKADADRALQQMIENENVSEVSQLNTTMTLERRLGFRIGKS